MKDNTPAFYKAIEPQLIHAAKWIKHCEALYYEANDAQKAEIVLELIDKYPFAFDLEIVRAEQTRWQRQGRAKYLMQKTLSRKGKRCYETACKMAEKRNEICHWVQKFINGGMSTTAALEATSKKMNISEPHIRKQYYQGRKQKPFFYFKKDGNGYTVKWGPVKLICENRIGFDFYFEYTLQV